MTKSFREGGVTYAQWESLLEYGAKFEEEKQKFMAACLGAEIKETPKTNSPKDLRRLKPEELLKLDPKVFEDLPLEEKTKLTNKMMNYVKQQLSVTDSFKQN